MLSKIILSSRKIILLCFPISSTIRCFVLISPNSSRCCISKSMILSRPGWEIEIIRPLLICFRSSIQKFGAVRGAALFVSVRYSKGRLALELINIRYCVLSDFMVSINSSDSVCAILYKRPFLILLFNSATRADTVIPSKAILRYSLIYY